MDDLRLDFNSFHRALANVQKERDKLEGNICTLNAILLDDENTNKIIKGYDYDYE